MRVTLKKLLGDKKYRRMSLKRLTAIIGGGPSGLSYNHYACLPGNMSEHKAQLLYKKFHPGRPQKPKIRDAKG